MWRRLLGVFLVAALGFTLLAANARASVSIAATGMCAHWPATAADGDARPVHLLVDSTGLKLCGAGEWLVEKHGSKTRRSWWKLHLGVDAETGQIVASELTSKEIDDGVLAGPMIHQVTGVLVQIKSRPAQAHR